MPGATPPKTGRKLVVLSYGPDCKYIAKAMHQENQLTCKVEIPDFVCVFLPIKALFFLMFMSVRETLSGTHRHNINLDFYFYYYFSGDGRQRRAVRVLRDELQPRAQLAGEPPRQELPRSERTTIKFKYSTFCKVSVSTSIHQKKKHGFRSHFYSMLRDLRDRPFTFNPTSCWWTRTPFTFNLRCAHRHPAGGPELRRGAVRAGCHRSLY